MGGTAIVTGEFWFHLQSRVSDINCQEWFLSHPNDSAVWQRMSEERPSPATEEGTGRINFFSKFLPPLSSS